MFSGVQHEEPSPTSAHEAPGGYERHFGLAESPFALTSNPRFLFQSASYQAALNQIAYALPRHEPIIVLTGAIGTGKTTLCRILAERGGSRTLVATISSPPDNVDDLLRQVLDGFGVLTDDTSQVVQASHYGLIRTLQQFLVSLVPLRAQAVVILDEAQHLRPDVLEQIRLLSNLDSDSQSLQIILVGQPELDDLLARDDLRQLAQRISRRHRLQPLQPSEVSAYIDRRLRVARGNQSAGEPPWFTPEAIQAIATLSNGVPRVVNTLCDRALEAAWLDKTHTIDAPTVIHAAASLNIDTRSLTIAARHADAETLKPAERHVDVESLNVDAGDAAEESLNVEPRASVRVRVKRRYAQAAVAAVLVLSALLIWTIRDSGLSLVTRRTAAGPETTRATVPAVSMPTPGAPTAAAPVEAANAAEQSRTPSPVPTPNYLIIVASFQTRERAARVATDVAAMGLPASVRTMSGWQQVVVGPYPSRQEAVSAQTRLSEGRIADTEITVRGIQPPPGDEDARPR